MFIKQPIDAYQPIFVKLSKSQEKSDRYQPIFEDSIVEED